MRGVTRGSRKSRGCSPRAGRGSGKRIPTAQLGKVTMLSSSSSDSSDSDDDGKQEKDPTWSQHSEDTISLADRSRRVRKLPSRTSLQSPPPTPPQPTLPLVTVPSSTNAPNSETAALRAELADLKQLLLFAQASTSNPVNPSVTVRDPFPYSMLANHLSHGALPLFPPGPMASQLQGLASPPVTALHVQQQQHPAVQLMHALSARSHSDAWLSAMMLAAPIQR